MSAAGTDAAVAAPPRKRIHIWGILVLLLVVGAALAVWYAAHAAPKQWTETPATGPAEAEVARLLEQGLAAEFTKVRGSGEQKWRLLLRASDINAWLAVRLPQWLQYDREMPWPEGVANPQVWMDHTGVHGAARWNGWIVGSTWDVEAVSATAPARLKPTDSSIGRIQLPFGSGISKWFVPELADAYPMEVKLGDGRTVRVTGAQFSEGQVVLDCTTISP